VHGAGGFVGTLGPRGVSSDRTGALLRLDAGPELQNRVGGPHAAAIFGLRETTAYALLLEVFGDLVDAGAVPFDIEVLFRRETDDVQTAAMTARMALKRL
jgi:acyl-coenzyme A thioesterase PaaI-like protein